MPIVQFPNEILTGKAEPFTIGANNSKPWPEIEEILETARKLEEALKTIPMGYAGLAAPQIGIPRRMFAFAPSRGIRIFFNPTWRPLPSHKESGKPVAGETKQHEGCFSVQMAKIQVPVRRFTKIRVGAVEVLRWDDRKYAKLSMFQSELINWEARVWQHESDHLEGILLGGCKIEQIEKPPPVNAGLLGVIGRVMQ
jgi:peptide deformylase